MAPVSTYCAIVSVKRQVLLALTNRLFHDAEHVEFDPIRSRRGRAETGRGDRRHRRHGQGDGDGQPGGRGVPPADLHRPCPPHGLAQGDTAPDPGDVACARPAADRTARPDLSTRIAHSRTRAPRVGGVRSPGRRGGRARAVGRDHGRGGPPGRPRRPRGHRRGARRAGRGRRTRLGCG